MNSRNEVVEATGDAGSAESRALEEHHVQHASADDYVSKLKHSPFDY